MASKLVRLDVPSYEVLKRLKTEQRLDSLSAAVAELITNANNNGSLSEIRSQLQAIQGVLLAGDKPKIANFQQVMETGVPTILTGMPGSGKTYFTKQLVELIPGPALVVDVNDEYGDLANVQTISLGEFFGINFMKETRKLVLVPNSNIEVSRKELDLITGHLFQFQHSLADWVIVFEEAHRFVENASLRSFVAESRKFTRKTILISPQEEGFVGLGELFRPPLWGKDSVKIVSLRVSNPPLR